MKCLFVALMVVGLICSLQAQLPVNQASDNNVVVGNPAQPVQWIHRGTLQQAILSAQPTGTVWIPPTYNGTDCSPISTCNPGSVLVIDLRGGLFNTVPISGGGNCSGTCVNNVFGRSGPAIAANANDYGGVGIIEPNGNSSQISFASSPTGSVLVGNPSGAYWTLNTGGATFADVQGDQLLVGGGGPSWTLLAGGSSQGAFGLTKTDATLGFGGNTLFDLNATGLTITVPITVTSCTGCGSVAFAVDQFQVGTGSGTSTLLTAPQGALAYNTFGGGSQNLHQAGCADLAGGCSGSGLFLLQTGGTSINQTLQSPTANILTISGGTGPTQIDMQYSGTAEHAPQAAHSYLGVDANGALLFSSNNGNQFLPGPSSAILDSGCGGTVGTANSTAYIGWPANQSTTTCTGTVLSNTIVETPFPANGTVKNLVCSLATAGITGDQIIMYLDTGSGASASSLHCANGTALSCTDTTHTVTVSQGNLWTMRYLTASSGTETAAGWRCEMEFVRTP